MRTPLEHRSSPPRAVRDRLLRPGELRELRAARRELRRAIATARATQAGLDRATHPSLERALTHERARRRLTRAQNRVRVLLEVLYPSSGGRPRRP